MFFEIHYPCNILRSPKKADFFLATNFFEVLSFLALCGTVGVPRLAPDDHDDLKLHFPLAFLGDIQVIFLKNVRNIYYTWLFMFECLCWRCDIWDREMIATQLLFRFFVTSQNIFFNRGMCLMVYVLFLVSMTSFQTSLNVKFQCFDSNLYWWIQLNYSNVMWLRHKWSFILGILPPCAQKPALISG